MGIKCPKCHTENTSDSKFSKKCTKPRPGSEEISVSPIRTLETPVEGLQKGKAFTVKVTLEETHESDCI